MFHENDLPLVGCGKNMLGVCVPPNERPDIVPDEAGLVHPNTGGMSVGPKWRDLPPFLIPARLKHQVPDARGKGSLKCFRFGDGDFENGELDPGLVLNIDRPTHGTVQPMTAVSLVAFQQQLAKTQQRWIEDEE
jgi:hypothetical protein